MRQSKFRKPKLVGDYLNQTLKKYGLYDKIKEHLIYVIWDKEVGKEVAAHTKPVFFMHGKLFVNVDNSVWLNELKYLKEDIKEKLNLKLKNKKIKEIYFKAGGLTQGEESKKREEGY